MRVTICLLLFTVCALADKNASRRTKPFIADAVGNTLPPPSSLPATVGSPINLLTPDRYEFYTFDESGELVKRLMTLEEIQAIVAAGEDSEGLVTFANDNQPTIALNFSQAPYNKVHSVVTNVQNVLKAQMEAHKNKPLVQPTLDTPDVSDSWSLILPSIFGNSGVDIVPDKAGSSFTPETDTFDDDFQTNDEHNSLSKEGSAQITTSAPLDNIDDKKIPTETTSPSTTTTTTTTTTTMKPTTTRKVTTTVKPVSTTKRQKLVTTTRPRTTTTKVPLTTTTTKEQLKTKTTATTASWPLTTTTTTTTTKKPTTTVKPTTTTTIPKQAVTTKKPASSTSAFAPEQDFSNDIPTSNPIKEFEKISTFIPDSTVKYGTQRTTQTSFESTKVPPVYSSTTKRSPLTTTKQPRPLSSTQAPKLQANVTSATNLIPSSTNKPELEKIINGTTVTTQSVSPSTTVSSTEFLSFDDSQSDELNDSNDIPALPIFDVAQSISQIASDLGSNYQPIPTSSNLLDTTKVNTLDEIESKESLEIDILNEEQSTIKSQNEDNFVKISTIDPHPNQNDEMNQNTDDIKEIIQTTTEVLTTTENSDITEELNSSERSTTIDPILTDSMEDLISQVVNEAPKPELDSKVQQNYENVITTEIIFDTTTELLIDSTTETSTSESNLSTSTPKISTKVEKVSSVELTTEKVSSEQEIKNVDDEPKDFVKISISTTTNNTLDTENQHKNETALNFNKIVTSGNNIIPQTPIKNDQIEENKHPIKKTQVVVTSTPKVETLKPQTVNDKYPNGNASSSQSSINNISDGEKSDNTNKKDKIPDSIPKIEEFKKKIQKINDEELANDKNGPWKLIPTVTPPKGNDLLKEKYKPDVPNSVSEENKNVVLEFSKENQGLEVTTKDLGDDIAQFTELCNELAFRYWNTMIENIDKKRSFVMSPYSITSMLAMMFMGARGATSGEMNEILKLDDMVTFNPHFTLKNISDSIESATNSGIAVSAFVRELFSDRNKGKILTFYKERAQHFYSGHVEEINFKLIGDIIRRRTNLLVKKHTWGKIPEYMKTNNIVMKPPLAAFSTNIYHTDCAGTSIDGRDGEMYFVVSPNVRQRRLVPVPAVVYKSGFLAGYDPVLDATAAALGNTNSIVSTIFLMPGQQGNIVHAEDLERLEKRLLETNPTTSAWSRLLRTLLPRVGLELQIPRFSHKSVFNVSSTLREMGLKDLFDADHADLGGLIGPSKDLYLSDMIQVTSFVTCGEGMVGEQHHIEEYPEAAGLARRRVSRWADWDEPRDYQRAFHDPHDVGEAMHLPLHLRPRQARLPTRSVQPARLKFDRPFLFFVRHNPSGMILYTGRYNPRLLP